VSVYGRLCLWVQEWLADGASGKMVYVIGMLPMFLVPLIGQWLLVPSVVAGSIWMAFVTWRWLLMMQTGFVETNLFAKRNKSNG